MSDATLAGAAKLPVFGCFVSIKRQGHLRGCCGFLGRRASLAGAIQESAVTSATGDVRLPSVSVSELPHLNFEVWLLYGRRPMESRGPDRIREVQIGRHGLQIQRGQARGLLLPGVAVDHDLDSEAFLQQVCIKAGLPPSAWREDETQLATFEGTVIRGGFDPDVLEPVDEQDALRLNSDELQQLVAFCRENVAAVARGAVPNYYLPGCSDGSAHGANLEVQVVGRADPIQIARLSLRKPVPIQATLFQMCETAGRHLRAEGLGHLAAADVDVRLGLLYSPAVHGSVEEPDLAGLDPTQRALLVSQGPRSAWVFDPQLSAEKLLETAKEQAEISLPGAAAVHSFLAQVTHAPMTVANVPRAQQGPSTRPPAVAGLFYPQEPEQVSRMLDKLVPSEPVGQEPWKAALVPHAGWVYSGRIAADVLRRIQYPERIIVLGPKHTSLGVEWAVAPCDAWSLPGLTVPSDRSLADRLCAAIEGLQLDAQAHQQEHAIEVELPLLARFAPEARVVGIAIGNSSLESCQEFGRGLAEVLRQDDEPTLLVISSDMNHYASDSETRRIDARAIEALETRDPETLYRTVRDNHISMCGMLPACIVLECLRQLGPLTRAEKVAYGTSADVSGDTSRVVGYAGMLFA
jgi:AmmeMemoRadiSam system protein B/AmmeMemoRadiSam system protein A